MGSHAEVPKRGGGIVSDQWGSVGTVGGGSGGAIGRLSKVGETTSDDGEEDEEGGVRIGSC